jgi:hypothetical protein
VIDSGYVCATSSRFEVQWEAQMLRCSKVSLNRQIEPLLLAVLFVVPVVVLAQGSPFHCGFTGIQSLFDRHHCESSKSGCNRDRRLRLRPRRTRCQRRRPALPPELECRSRRECPELALGRIAPIPVTFNPRLVAGHESGGSYRTQAGPMDSQPHLCLPREREEL